MGLTFLAICNKPYICTYLCIYIDMFVYAVYYRLLYIYKLYYAVKQNSVVNGKIRIWERGLRAVEGRMEGSSVSFLNLKTGILYSEAIVPFICLWLNLFSSLMSKQATQRFNFTAIKGWTIQGFSLSSAWDRVRLTSILS